VIILLGSAAISFVLALFDDKEGWTAFVDPLVVRTARLQVACGELTPAALDPHYSDPECRCGSVTGKQRRKGYCCAARVFSE